VELLTAIVAACAALVTAGLGVVAFRLSRAGSRYAARRAIGDLANSLATFRAEYPEVMSVARNWTPASWERLFAAPATDESKGLARYYSFVEIGLEFCNTTLGAYAEGHLPRDAFERHYRPLVRLFVTENWPMISDLLTKPYLSDYLRDEVDAGGAGGWAWATEHRKMLGMPKV
jgi:hypothetical protein